MAKQLSKAKNPTKANDLTDADERDTDKPIEHGKPEIEQITAHEIMERAEAVNQYLMHDRKEYQHNALFLEGSQWVKYVDATKAFIPWNRIGGRSKITVNKLDSIVATYMSKITRTDMRFEVPASTADDYAIEGSLVSQAIIAYKHDECNWEGKREELLLAAIKGGTSALIVEWDPSAKAYGSVRTGDTVEKVRNITQFGVEPGAEEARTARWMTTQAVLPSPEVQAIYKLKEMPKDDSTGGSPYSTGVQGNSIGTATRGTLVTTYYERPNFLRPEGAVAVVVNEKLVWGPKPWPFPFKDHLNIDVLRETLIDGQWNGSTRLTKARPVQLAYNFVNSNIDEHIKKVGTAKPMAPYGSSEVFEQWDDDPANSIRYPDGASPPGYLQPPNMPAYILNRLATLEADMQDIMGIHGVSQGQAPGGIQSGSGVQQLIEQDASPATSVAKRTARVFENTASDILCLLSANVSETRTATVYGADGKVAESAKWTGKTIAGQTKVSIPEDAVIPHSRAAMQQFAETIAKMGLLPPGQAGLTLLLELAEVPNREQSLWYVNAPEARSRYDVSRIFQGEIVEPRDFQNHKVAIEVGNRARMSPRYDQAGKKIQERLDLFVQTHETMAAEEAGQQMAKAAVSPALAGAATANQAEPLPPELTGVAPMQPGTMPSGGGDQPQMPQLEQPQTGA